MAQLALNWHLASLTAEMPVYRGPDRRHRAGSAATRTGSARIALPLFLLVSHLVALTASWQGSWSVSGLTDWLTPSVAVISGVAGAIHVVRWRLAGAASSLWVGAGLLIYGGANIAFPNLVRSFTAHDAEAESLVGLLRPTSVFVVMALLAMAAVAPAIDAQLRPRRVAGFTACTALVGIAASWVSPEFRQLLGPALDRAPHSGFGAFGQVGVGLLWLGLGCAFLFQLSRAGRERAAWIGVMLLGLAEARLALAMSVDGHPGWMLSSQVFRMFAVAAAFGGAVRDLQVTFAEQRSRLLASLMDLGLAQAQRRAELATAEERAHDLRAALVGIGGAAVTLERYHEQLTDDERSGLARAVSAEIARLQEIVSEVRAAPVVFELMPVLHPLVVCAGSHGASIEVDVPDELTAAGRPGEVAEVLQNLLENARRHAPGSAVAVRARRRGSTVQVRVEDRGPGIAPTDRSSIFERGWRRDEGVEGSGLGLHVARRLAREQCGDLRVEDTPGGGASFVLELPSASPGGDR